MTRKEAQQILERIDRLDAKVERWSKQLSRCRELVQSMTAGTSMQDVIVQGGVWSSGAEWDDYLTASAEYDKAVDAYADHRDRIMAAFDRMENVMETRVLNLRYMSRPQKEWRDISGELGYSTAHVFRLHSDALEHFADAWGKVESK